MIIAADIHAIRICPLSVAADDNMGPGILIWDKQRNALYARDALLEEQVWIDIETGRYYRSVRGEIIDVTDADGASR